MARFPVSMDGPKGSPFGTRCLRATALYRCLLASSRAKPMTHASPKRFPTSICLSVRSVYTRQPGTVPYIQRACKQHAFSGTKKLTHHKGAVMSLPLNTNRSCEAQTRHGPIQSGLLNCTLRVRERRKRTRTKRANTHGCYLGETHPGRDSLVLRRVRLAEPR